MNLTSDPEALQNFVWSEERWPPDPFETELVVPFPLEDTQEPVASA